ncbi:hypothetical protein SLE2022_206440 [Rubroshorea leprosula]
MKNLVSLLLCMLAFGVLAFTEASRLQEDFYCHSCPLAEEIIKNLTWEHVKANPTLPARLLRLHFHDCFVRGCDGSILLNSTANNTAEKAATPNLTLLGFDVIDDIKEKVEEACPGVVSCADILALAARDSVSFQYKRNLWKVYTGRRDGTISRASEVLGNIPSPVSNFTVLKQNFAKKGLDVLDLVVLSGGHTIGVGHCDAFSYRLYNFTGKGDQDPSLDPSYAAFLKTQCKSLSDNTTIVAMDPGSALNFDNHYYVTLEQHKGLFQSDAALLTNEDARNIVQEFLTSSTFFGQFAESMVKMGDIEVLTGEQGQIREHCAFVNFLSSY